MSKKHKRRSMPPRRTVIERTDPIGAIVRAAIKGLVDGFLSWISRGGRL